MRHEFAADAPHHLLPDLSRCLIRAAAQLSLTGDAAVIRESWLDPERFYVLLDTYFLDIHRYVARRIGVPCAGRVAAEVFVAAFDGRHRYDLTQASARPWLYGIASRSVGRHRRHEVARYRTLARGTGAGDVRDQVGIGASLTPPQQCQRVAGALALLRAGERDALLCTALGGLSDVETATALGISAVVARSRLRRARGKLRAALGWQADGAAGAVGTDGPVGADGAVGTGGTVGTVGTGHTVGTVGTGRTVGQNPGRAELLVVRQTLPEPPRPDGSVFADCRALLRESPRGGVARWRTDALRALSLGSSVTGMRVLLALLGLPR